MRLLTESSTSGYPPSLDEASLWREITGSTSPLLRVNGHGPQLILHQHKPHQSPFEALRTLPTQDHSIACLSDHSNRFMGQNGRSWSAALGNLHLSVRIPCHLPVRKAIQFIPALPALALVNWMESEMPSLPRPQIKWVNDLWLDGKKLAGTLSASSLQGDHIDSLIFGIGLNLNTAPNIRPDPFVPGACHLGQWLAKPPEPLSAAKSIIHQLEALVSLLSKGDPSPLFLKFRKHLAGIGREVRIWPDRGEDPSITPPSHQARLVDLHPETLGLLLEGYPDPITQGRLAL